MSTPAEKLFDSVEWKSTGLLDAGDGLPFATHTGIVKLGELEIECAVLNDGRRIFTGKVIEDLIKGAIEFNYSPTMIHFKKP